MIGTMGMLNESVYADRADRKDVPSSSPFLHHESILPLSTQQVPPCSCDEVTDGTDWWPKRLGGKTSYALSWCLTLAIGLTAHHLDLFKMRERRKGKDQGADELDWERKSKLSAWTRALEKGED
jgi:hypothetical protein